MPQSMRISRENSTLLLTLSGRVIAKDTVTLREDIEELMKSDMPVKAIDLTDVEYIDSYALGQIIYYCNNNAAESRGTVYIMNRKHGKKSYIDKLIDVSDMRRIFTIVDTLDATDPHPGSGA
jgi:anti-anti-sigma factor